MTPPSRLVTTFPAPSRRILPKIDPLLMTMVLPAGPLARIAVPLDGVASPWIVPSFSILFAVPPNSRIAATSRSFGSTD